jgi:hypothetical protein
MPPNAENTFHFFLGGKQQFIAMAKQKPEIQSLGLYQVI